VRLSIHLFQSFDLHRSFATRCTPVVGVTFVPYEIEYRDQNISYLSIDAKYEISFLTYFSYSILKSGLVMYPCDSVSRNNFWNV
jgi:hypothetical protein